MISSAPRDYFCDISSLASDDQHANDTHTIDSNQTVLLYQRLERIEELTAHVLLERPHVLQAGHDAFAEIEPKCTQDFEIKLPSTFSTTDVVLLTIVCIPDCMVDDNEFWLDSSVRPPIRHHPLELTLTRKKINIQQQVTGGGLSNSMCNTDKDIKLQVNPTLFNGEYSFVLTSAHGLGPSCTIVLSVRGEAKAIAEMGLSNHHSLHLPHSSSHSHDGHLAGSPVQPIRVSYKAVAGVRAVPLANGKAVTGRVLMGESKFYRFVCQDRQKLVSIRVRPIPSHRGDESPSNTMVGDPDVYVSNKHEGFVEVTRDNCVWRSTHVGADRIDIHPNDPNVALGSTFVIAVVGYRDNSNDYEITATISDPPKIDFLLPTTSSLLKRELAVVKEKYTYHGVKIDPRQRGEIVVAITATSSPSSSSSNAGARALLSRSAIASAFDSDIIGPTTSHLQYATTTQQLHHIAHHRIDARYGRCVYTADELPTYAIDLANHSTAGSGNNSNNTTFGITSSSPMIALPDSTSRKNGVYPIVYASATCMYPSAQDYTWRASGADGTAFLSIEMSEWKNTGGTLYFSIYGLPIESTMDTNIVTNTVGGMDIIHDSCTLQESSSYMSLNRDQSHSMDTTSGMGVSHLFHSTNRPPIVVKEINPTTSFLLPSSQSSSSSSITCQVIFGIHDEITNLNDNAMARFHLYRDVYRDVDGTGLSLRERSRLSIDDNNFSYGEIEYLSFQQLLVESGAGDGQVLYDLGSGIGRAVVAAALSGIRFLRCVGIEALPSLHDCAHDIIEEIQRCMSSIRGTGHHTQSSSHVLLTPMNYTLPAGLPLMEVRLGDMLTEDWSDADFVFVTSVCYSETIMTQLLEIAAMRLRQGARLVTLSLPTSMHGMLAKFDAIMHHGNKAASSYHMTGKMYREGGERMVEEEDACFVLERTAWCKSTWGKVRAYVLIRTAVIAPVVEI